MTPWLWNCGLSDERTHFMLRLIGSAFQPRPSQLKPFSLSHLSLERRKVRCSYLSMDEAIVGSPNPKEVGENLPLQPKSGGAAIVDMGGRRSGIDRRTFSYTLHIPERRSGADRRCGQDRRRNKRRNNHSEFESNQAAGLQNTF